MKIALVNWPINDVGGINSWCLNFQDGCRAAGHIADHFYATAQTRFEVDPEHHLVKTRYSRLAGWHLPYRKEKLKESITKLNSYDLVVFIHPSPHPTRANESKPDARLWMELYRQCKKPKLVVFHDWWWNKNNQWLAEVADHVDACLAAQRAFLPSVEEYPSPCPKAWEYFPIVLPKVVPRKKTKQLILATQWLKLKNHHKFLPQLPQIKVPVRLYGNGQEYYTCRNSGMFEVLHTDHTTGTVYNKQSLHHFYGYVPYTEIQSQMSRSAASIDLSIQGQINMTHWEPLAYRAVSFMERRAVEHKHNQIPRDCCAPYDLENAAETINSVMKRPFLMEDIRNRAWKFIQQADHVKVVKRILLWLKKETVI